MNRRDFTRNLLTGFAVAPTIIKGLISTKNDASADILIPSTIKSHPCEGDLIFLDGAMRMYCYDTWQKIVLT